MFVNALSGGDNLDISSLGHRVNDILLVFACNDGAALAPSLASLYTSILTKTNTTADDCGVRLGYKISDGTETAAGTWSNADSLVVLCYRFPESSPIGASGSDASSLSPGGWDWPDITLTKTPTGRSWIMAFAFASTGSASFTTPTGFTSRHTYDTGTTTMQAWDSAAPTSNYSSSTGYGGGGSIGAMVEVQFQPVGGVLFWAFP